MSVLVMRSSWIVGFMAAVLCQGVTAEELNTFRGAGAGPQAKIARHVAQINATDSDFSTQNQDQVGCNQEVGNLVVSNNSGAAPREQITVIRGDAINVCR
jgi:hypothetical protein